MSQNLNPNILTLAQQGHPGAISWLLNRDLVGFGVSVQAVRRHGCLLVLLEGDQVPTPSLMMSRIKQLLNRLGSPLVSTVKVYGRERGQKTPTWMRELRMELHISDHLPAEAIAPLPQPVKQATAFLDALAVEDRTTAPTPTTPTTVSSRASRPLPPNQNTKTHLSQKRIAQSSEKAVPRYMTTDDRSIVQPHMLGGDWHHLLTWLRQTAIYWLVPERVRRRTVKQILHRQRRNQLLAVLAASLVGVCIAISLILVLEWLQS